MGKRRPGESEGIAQVFKSGLEPGLDPQCPPAITSFPALFHINFQHYTFSIHTWGTLRSNSALRFTREKIPSTELFIHRAGRKEWVEIMSSRYPSLASTGWDWPISQLCLWALQGGDVGCRVPRFSYQSHLRSWGEENIKILKYPRNPSGPRPFSDNFLKDISHFQ